MYSCFISHLVGDYLLQNDYIAKYKKENALVCVVHVLLYLFPFLFFTELSVLQLSLVGVEHFLQDRWNFVVWFMKKKGSGSFIESCGPWSIIVTDNVLHLVFIFLVVKYIH